MADFFDSILAFGPLSVEARNALRSILVRKEAQKGEVLVKEGSVCNYLYFVESGLTRTYYYKEDRYVTDWISMEGMFACSIMSFISRQPDRRGIETLEESVLYGLPYYETEQLCARHHDVERLMRRLVSHGLIQVQQRFDDLHFSTAFERYRKLIERTPGLLQRVPLGMLASYLGMSQETLSRIRRQV